MRFLLNPISGQLNAAPSKEIVYSDTAPFAPLEGLRWADTTNLREYIFTDGYWVEVGVGFVGPIGPIGLTGATGTAATVAVGTTTTGAAGTSAAVSNSGTTSSATLDFIIPKGADGINGAAGATGKSAYQLAVDGGYALSAAAWSASVKGVKGDAGTSVVLRGSVTTFASLPTTNRTIGDVWITSDTGDGYAWSGTAWSNVGRIQGPAGLVPSGTGAVVVSNGVLQTPIDVATTNTASTIVQRDASGNFSAGTITGTFSGNVTGNVTGGITGNAGSATKLSTARSINVSGDVTGTAQSFDGSANITIPTAITADSIVNADINSAAAIADTKLATIATAGKVSNSATTATSANAANAIVARDNSGNFSAGTITANLTGSVSGNAANVTGTVAIANGGTGSTTAAAALIALGAAATSHQHGAGDITSGTLANAQLPARLQSAAQTITDWNNAVENGWYQGSNAANAPEGVLDWWLGCVETHYDRWVTQTVHRFTQDAPTNTQIWRRSSADSGATVRTFSAWYKLQLSQGEQDARYAATTDARLSDARTPTLHTHDDRYYTETETNTLLAGKSATAHTHDDRYYTETETNTLLAGKSATTHTHPYAQIAADSPYKDGVTVATTGSLPAYGLQKDDPLLLTGDVSVADYTAIPIIDGVTLTVGMRILVKNQGIGSANNPSYNYPEENGVYVVTRLGTASTGWQLTRATDADSSSELAGATVSVDRGTANGGKLFKTSFTSTNTVATTACKWQQIVTSDFSELFPAGAIMPFARNKVPAGWLAANGALVDREVYANLFAQIGVVYGVGDGGSTFGLPDLRAVFVRGAGTNAVSGEASGTFGANQADAIQNIKGKIDFGSNSGINVTMTGAFYSSEGATSRQVGFGSGSVEGDYSFDASRVVRTDTETRPRNIAMLYCIKY